MRTILGIFGLIILLISCTEDFEPRAEFRALASPYGFLRVDADTQWVRVSTTRNTIERPVEVDSNLFRFRHFTDNDTVNWQPMLKTMDDGSVALLFFTTDRILPETEYTVELTGEGYPLVTTTIRSPKRVESIEVDDPNPYIRPFRQTFFIPVLDDFFTINLTAMVRKDGDEEAHPYPVVVVDPSTLRWSEAGITAMFNHDETIRQLFNFGHIEVRVDGAQGLITYQLEEIILNVTLTHEGWFPRFFYWDDSFAKILEYTNTNTGSGFVGSASMSHRSWKPPSFMKLYFNYDGWLIEVQ